MKKMFIQSHFKIASDKRHNTLQTNNLIFLKSEIITILA
jgi:hypothetical protein